ncbi:MAG: hypothetical protein ACR2NR_01685 [Solirubrobacteraceae bacterium]
MTRRRRRIPAALVAVAAVASVAGCGSTGPTTLSVPKVAPARVFTLARFAPAGRIVAGRPTTMSFDVQLPDGHALTTYKTGSGPHTGVHLIIVRDDLADIIHDHPPIPPNGMLHQQVTFPAPGPYRVLVDIYPNIPGGSPNFQLFRTVHVGAGAYHPIKLPPFQASQLIDGYHFVMRGNTRGPHLHAIQAQFLHVEVTDPHGQPVHFTPWFGALAHAIFFRDGSLDYFHTHVCAPDAPNCGTLPGVASSRISGRASAPDKITIGVLLPVSGTWRLFLQLRQHGHILTAPYTLRVK